MKSVLKNKAKPSVYFEKIIADLQLQLDQQARELASYKEKYARLIEEILLMRQQRFAPSAEKNVLQSDLFDEAGIELPDEVVVQLEENIEVTSHSRKKQPKRRPLPAYLPREVVVHDLADADKVCGCGAALVRIGEETSEQLKYIPA